MNTGRRTSGHGSVPCVPSCIYCACTSSRDIALGLDGLTARESMMNHSIAATGIGSRRPRRVLAAALLALGLAVPAMAMAMAQAAPAASAEPDQPTNALVPPTSASDFTASQLDDVLAGSWRLAANSARDVYRHPKATLQFFGVRPDQTI